MHGIDNMNTWQVLHVSGGYHISSRIAASLNTNHRCSSRLGCRNPNILAKLSCEDCYTAYFNWSSSYHSKAVNWGHCFFVNVTQSALLTFSTWRDMSVFIPLRYFFFFWEDVSKVNFVFTVFFCLHIFVQLLVYYFNSFLCSFWFLFESAPVVIFCSIGSVSWLYFSLNNSEILRFWLYIAMLRFLFACNEFPFN